MVDKISGSMGIEDMMKKASSYKLTNNLSKEFVDKILPYIKLMFKIKPNNTRHDDSEELNEIDFNPLINVDENLDYIYKFGKEKMNTPNNTSCHMFIGTYMRTAKMEIPKAQEGTIYRILINLNEDELYLFIEKPVNKQIFYEKNTFMIIPDFDKIIVTSRNPNSKIPSNPGAPGLASVDRTIIRSLKYQRYTIVLDYLTPPNVDENTSEMLKSIEKNLSDSLKAADKNTKQRKKKKLLSNMMNKAKMNETNQEMSETNKEKEKIVVDNNTKEYLQDDEDSDDE